MMRLLRSAFVIARRDFTATVLSKAFLFFLLGPLFPLLLGGVFAGIGTRVATQAENPVVAVVASRADFARISAARDQLAQAIGQDSVTKLVRYEPGRNLAAQQKRLLATTNPAVRAILMGGLAQPHLVGPVDADGPTAGQLRLILASA